MLVVNSYLCLRNIGSDSFNIPYLLYGLCFHFVEISWRNKYINIAKAMGATTSQLPFVMYITAKGTVAGLVIMTASFLP